MGPIPKSFYGVQIPTHGLRFRLKEISGTMTKHFGFWTLVFLVIANMIGAGVFTTSGFALVDLGSPHLVVGAWFVGGMIALAGAISYGMLVQAMPESGGEYLFLSRAAHPIFGFIAGWVSLIAGFSGAIAFAASALEGYVLPDGTRPTWLPPGSLAIASIIVAGLLHGVRIRFGALAQNAVVAIKLTMLAAILIFAALNGSYDGWHSTSPETNLQGWPLVAAFAASLVWISLSYSGFNAAVYVAEEVDNAKRVVPRALLTGTAIVVVLYLLLNAVFVYAPPAELIAGKPDVAAIAARVVGGPTFEMFVRSTIVICLLTSVFSMLMAAPRVYAKMASDGLMPAALQFDGAAPHAAVMLQVVLASVFVLVSSIQGLLSYLGLTLSLCAVGSVSCLFLPKVRSRPLLHPLHSIPLFYIAATLTAATIMTRSNPWQIVGTLLTFSLGAIFYAVMRRPGASQHLARPNRETTN
jgi:APA family basic amino acid/polyamine antiporter